MKKVLILSASVGAGHMRAAEAVEKALISEYPTLEVKNIDVLQFTNPLFRRLYSKLYLDLVKSMPDVLGWIYDSLDKPWQMERRRLAMDRLNTGPFIKFLKKEEPDLCVATHFLPSEIISWLTAKGQVSTKQAIVVTDFDAHAMWLCRNYERYFVPIEETAVYLEAVGIDKTRISVSGIPIDPVFANRKDKIEMRRKHGLDTDRKVILVSAGGFGVGNLEPLMKAFQTVSTPCEIVPICGRNEALLKEMKSFAGRNPSGVVSFKPIGFTKEMDELMSAADLIVGKPGGLTTSEAMAKGLVFVVVNPIPGQEERNSDHLLEKGCAIKSNNLQTLGFKIDRLLSNPKKLETMRKNALEFGTPDSAKRVADSIYKMLSD
ncbi:MAG: glycosyltransferase [Pyrinomonadaceae bacterium]